jgi:hypothetical protein
MNIGTKRILNRAAHSLVIGAGLLLLSTVDATAHDVDYRSYVAQRHYVLSPPGPFPRWLRENREFQHWYVGSHYRLKRDLGWQRIYDAYYFERRYRLQSHRYYGRAGHDHAHRSHRGKKSKRRH